MPLCNLCGDPPEYCDCNTPEYEEDYCDDCGEHYDDCYCHLGFNND